MMYQIERKGIIKYFFTFIIFYTTEKQIRKTKNGHMKTFNFILLLIHGMHLINF